MPADTTYALRITRPYTLSGRTITVGERLPCPPNASCLGIDEGLVVGDRILMVRHALLGSQAVLAFDREKVDRVEIVAGARSVTLAKSGTDWRIVAPVAAR